MAFPTLSAAVPFLRAVARRFFVSMPWLGFLVLVFLQIFRKVRFFLVDSTSLTILASLAPDFNCLARRNSQQPF